MTTMQSMIIKTRNPTPRRLAQPGLARGDDAFEPPWVQDVSLLILCCYDFCVDSLSVFVVC